MAATQRKDAEPAPGPERPDALGALIADQVVRALGTPEGLFRVQVRRLWDRSYRVNVLLWPDTFPTRISDSFFVTVNGDGAILEACPRIARKY